MKDAQKTDRISLAKLIDCLKEGHFVIPDFQREFAWKSSDIKDLVRSIFLDYYIGSLLLWKGKKESFDSLSCQTIYGFANEGEQILWSRSDGKPDYIVLDGQQRLTALYYALVAPEVALPKAKRMLYYIRVDKFMEEEHDKAFECDRLSRRFNKIMNSPEAQYAEHIFPLSVIGQGERASLEWVLGYEKFWKEKMEKAGNEGDTSACEIATQYVKDVKKFDEHLRGITGGYQVAYIELDKELGINKVCDIFTKINSTGTPLDVFDLINALLKPEGLQLKYMWQDVSPRLKFIKTKKMNVYVLQVMSLLCQAYCSPKYLYYLLPGKEKQIRTADGEWEKRILVPDAKDFVRRWDDAVESIEHAISLLKDPREFGAIAYQYLPYTSILPVFAALQSICRDLPKVQQFDAQGKLGVGTGPLSSPIDTRDPWNLPVHAISAMWKHG